MTSGLVSHPMTGHNTHVAVTVSVRVVVSLTASVPFKDEYEVWEKKLMTTL